MYQNIVNVYEDKITVKIPSPLELKYKIVNGYISFTEAYVRLVSKKNGVLLLLPRSNTVVIYPDNIK